MAKTQVIIECIRLYTDDVRATVTVTTKEEFEGYHSVNDGFELGQVNKFSIDRAAFTKQVCNTDGDGEIIADYRATRETGFDQKALALIFRGATLVIDRVQHKEGEEVCDEDGVVVKDSDGNAVVYSRDCYTTTIVGVRLTNTARERLENALVL